MDSPFTQRRSGLLRLPLNSTSNTTQPGHNLSITLLPEEEEMLKNTSAGALGLLSRLNNRTTNVMDVSTLSVADSSLILDDMNDGDRGRGKTDLLFAHFYEILQSHANENDSLDVVQQLAKVCRQVVDQLELEIERGVGGSQGTKQREASIVWLKQEINTWRLLHALYYDRLLNQSDTQADDEMQDGPMLGGSEKEVGSIQSNIELFTYFASSPGYPAVILYKLAAA